MKSNIETTVKTMIKKGLSKKEIYDQLAPDFRDRIKLAKTIQSIPSLKARTKYRTLNTILLIIWILIALIDLLGQSYVGFIIDILFIYIVATYQSKQYSWILVRAFFSIISGVIIMIYYSSNYTVLIPMIIVFLMIIASFVIGLYLSNKLTPETKTVQVKFMDSEGNVKIRNDIDFGE